MKKILLPLLLALLPLSAVAQTAVDDENDFQTRVTVGFDKKLSKGLHFSVLEQFRFKNSSTDIDCFLTNLALSYKINSYLKAGISYALINPYKSSASSFNNPRHRFAADLTGSIKTGDWTFSLRERFQVTHRSGDFNEYQTAANAMVLKSRLSAKYRGFDGFKPYGFLELRNTLNAPAISATYSASTDKYLTSAGAEEGEAGWFISGWNNMYINRYRLGLGCDFELAPQHELDVFLYTDYYTDKSVDANGSGTRLKSYTIQHGFNAVLGVGYTFSF